MDENDTLARRARSFRRARHMTQQEIAQRAGLSKTHVHQIETGKRKRMRMDTMIRYSAALGVQPIDLDPTIRLAQDDAQGFNLEVNLRRTRELSEEDIQQVLRFIDALKAKNAWEALQERQRDEKSVE